MGMKWELPSFEALVAFNRMDPVGYASFRERILTEQIANAPLEQRPALRRTLNAIEVARQNAKSPLEAAALAHSLMCASVADLHSGLEQLIWAGAGLQTAAVISKAKAASLFDQG